VSANPWCGIVQLLPTVMTCMDEDYYADTRRAGTYLMEMILQVSSDAKVANRRVGHGTTENGP
jgi:hypothetical protein